MNIEEFHNQNESAKTTPLNVSAGTIANIVVESSESRPSYAREAAHVIADQIEEDLYLVEFSSQEDAEEAVRESARCFLANLDEHTRYYIYESFTFTPTMRA